MYVLRGTLSGERKNGHALLHSCLPSLPEPWPKKKKKRTKRGKKKSIAAAKKEIALIQIVLFKKP